MIEWTKLAYKAEHADVSIREPGDSTLQLMRGVRLTAAVPYVGNRALLTHRPTKHGTGSGGRKVGIQPAGAEHGRITVEFEGRHLHIEDVERERGDLGIHIAKHLDYARADIDRYREQIIPELLNVIAARKTAHDELDDLERRLTAP